VVAGVALTHPGRVLYEPQGITKAELARYYEQAAEWMLPYVTRRPLMLLRCPEGVHRDCFVQKRATKGTGEPIHHAMVRERTGTWPSPWVDSAAGLVALAQLGVLEVHTWGARLDDLEHPDQLVFDLDPDEAMPWRDVVLAAREVRVTLTEAGLESFVRTTGGKGLHVVVPLVPGAPWSKAKSFAKSVAELLVERGEGRYVSVAGKSRRPGKIFVDYLRNSRGATAIASWSTRARPGAPVAVPLAWSELDEHERPHVDLREAAALVGRLRRDPWAGFLEVRQALAR
jgi:bifunctional non-homologous end joining protein LigD